jgi:hypothetical protein
VAQSTIRETAPYSYWHVSPTGHVGEMGQYADCARRAEAAVRKTESPMFVDVVGKLVGEVVVG